jgi:hypothetical protein
LVLYQQSLDIRRQLADSEPGRADYQRDLSLAYNRLGMLALAIDDTSGAAEYLEEDLRIAVELYNREPQRADLAVDVAISLQLTGRLRNERARIEQAIAILRELQTQGRLPPDREALPEQVESDLQQM